MLYWTHNGVIVKKFNHLYKSSMSRTSLRPLTMFISDSWWLSLSIKLVTMILLNVTKIKCTTRYWSISFLVNHLHFCIFVITALSSNF